MNKYILLFIVIFVFTFFYFRDKIKIDFTNQEFFNYSNPQLYYLLALIILILGILYSQKECFVPTRPSSDRPSNIILAPNCSNSQQLMNIKKIVSNFNVTRPLVIKNALDDTNQFTVSVVLNVYDYQSSPEWKPIFFAGTPNAKLRTPGVWINQGYLHVRASTDKNWNDGQGCWRIEPPLERDMQYHLILVYNKNKITVYLDGRLIQDCPTTGIILPGKDLYIGNGPNIEISLSYLPLPLNNTDISNCWLLLKELTQSQIKDSNVTNSPIKYG